MQIGQRRQQRRNADRDEIHGINSRKPANQIIGRSGPCQRAPAVEIGHQKAAEGKKDGDALRSYTPARKCCDVHDFGINVRKDDDSGSEAPESIEACDVPDFGHE
jgi:hypothetical protein